MNEISKLTLFTPEVGKVSSQKRIIQTILEEKLRDAEKLGAKSESIEHPKKLFLRSQDGFWVKFVADPPVAVASVKVQLKEGSTPIMVKSRRYPPSHKDYLKKHLSELVDHNLVYRNPDSHWGSAPRIVAKKTVGKHRMTVNLRAINALAVPMA